MNHECCRGARKSLEGNQWWCIGKGDLIAGTGVDDEGGATLGADCEGPYTGSGCWTTTDMTKWAGRACAANPDDGMISPSNDVIPYGSAGTRSFAEKLETAGYNIWTNPAFSVPYSDEVSMLRGATKMMSRAHATWLANNSPVIRECDAALMVDKEPQQIQYTAPRLGGVFDCGSLVKAPPRSAPGVTQGRRAAICDHYGHDRRSDDTSLATYKAMVKKVDCEKGLGLIIGSFVC